MFYPHHHQMIATSGPELAKIKLFHQTFADMETNHLLQSNYVASRYFCLCCQLSQLPLNFQFWIKPLACSVC